jgi:type III pantothenate kinase
MLTFEIMSRNLVIDIGNHSSKLFIFENDSIVWQHKHSTAEIQSIPAMVSDHKFDTAIVSSVVPLDSRFIPQLNAIAPTIELNGSTRLPLKLSYDTPETLGADRIAAACGAWQLSSGSNVLVIVAGTCITYNLIDQSGTFQGGAISPGIHMRLQAMHSFTGKLPLVSADGNSPVVAKTTEASLRSGALNGTISELEGMIFRYSEQFPNLKVMLTGGDGEVLAEGLKNGIFARPDLIAQGLNNILNYNVVNRLIV